MRISDWSSDVGASDLDRVTVVGHRGGGGVASLFHGRLRFGGFFLRGRGFVLACGQCQDAGSQQDDDLGLHECVYSLRFPFPAVGSARNAITLPPRRKKSLEDQRLFPCYRSDEHTSELPSLL